MNCGPSIIELEQQKWGMDSRVRERRMLGTEVETADFAAITEEAHASHGTYDGQLTSAAATAYADASSAIQAIAGKRAAMHVTGYPPEQPVGHKGLTPEEEAVMLESLPMVRFVARRIHERLPQYVEIDDLFSAGVIGLMDALSKFDPIKKVKFSSYAQFRVRGAILDSLRTLDWSPRELRRKGRAVEAAISSLVPRLGHAPSESEIAAELGTPLEAYQRLLSDLKGLEIGTLHVEHNENSDEEELAYIPGRPDEDPLFICLRREMEELITDAIEGLPERERMMTTLYYYEELTMREIALAFGVGESRVSQILASAVLHLRSALSSFSSRGGGKKAKQQQVEAATRVPKASRRAGLWHQLCAYLAWVPHEPWFCEAFSMAACMLLLSFIAGETGPGVF